MNVNVESVLPLSYKIAKDYSRRTSYEFEDLQSAAITEVMRYIDRYDPNVSAFTTFSYMLMKQGIAHYIETEERNRKHTLSYDAEFASDNDNGDSLKSFADSLEDKRAYDEILDHVENVSLTMKLKNAPNLTRVLTEYVLAYAELHPEIYELNVSSARSLIRSVLKEDIALTDNMIRDYFRSMKELIYAED